MIALVLIAALLFGIVGGYLVTADHYQSKAMRALIAKNEEATRQAVNEGRACWLVEDDEAGI
jgi:uncharacterized protein YneF (UPF0154 family)